MVSHRLELNPFPKAQKRRVLPGQVQKRSQSNLSMHDRCEQIQWAKHIGYGLQSNDGSRSGFRITAAQDKSLEPLRYQTQFTIAMAKQQLLESRSNITPKRGKAAPSPPGMLGSAAMIPPVVTQTKASFLDYGLLHLHDQQQQHLQG